MNAYFQNPSYLGFNKIRLEHLASLNLPIKGREVLELGAGVGDMTSFFFDRACRVTTSDVRPENVAELHQRFPNVPSLVIDLNDPNCMAHIMPHDIVFAYGVLYHTSDPANAIRCISRVCKEMCLLETCVSYGDTSDVNLIEECALNPTQSANGKACRPTRKWVWEELKKNFKHVYLTATQPNHPQFPIDWTTLVQDQLQRSVFVASKFPMSANKLLSEVLLAQQVRFQ